MLISHEKVSGEQWIRSPVCNASVPETLVDLPRNMSLIAAGAQADELYSLSSQPDVFDDVQDLLFPDFLNFPAEIQDGGDKSSTQHAHSIDLPGHAPERKRVASNRKAQQRFRQRQKAKKTAQASELLYLRQRVTELEQLVSTRPADEVNVPAIQHMTQVCSLT